MKKCDGRDAGSSYTFPSLPFSSSKLEIFRASAPWKFPFLEIAHTLSQCYLMHNSIPRHFWHGGALSVEGRASEDSNRIRFAQSEAAFRGRAFGRSRGSDKLRRNVCLVERYTVWSVLGSHSSLTENRQPPELKGSPPEKNPMTRYPYNVGLGIAGSEYEARNSRRPPDRSAGLPAGDLLRSRPLQFCAQSQAK
jgi:hypothetical protein